MKVKIALITLVVLLSFFVMSVGTSERAPLSSSPDFSVVQSANKLIPPNNAPMGKMKEAISPGVYVEELPSSGFTITGVETAVAGFLGQTEKGPVEPKLITSYQEYETLYGGNPQGQLFLPYAVKGFFDNGGRKLYIARVVSTAKSLNPSPNQKLGGLAKSMPSPPNFGDYLGNPATASTPATGLHALGLIDDITILYAPDAHGLPDLQQALIEQCEELGDRVVILESALGDTEPEPMDVFESSFAAYYYPWLQITDSSGKAKLVPPGGFIAGSYSKVDETWGVHKTPANITIQGVTGVERSISKGEQDSLYIKMVNPIKFLQGRGIVANGGRLLSQDSEYRYICIRRFSNYIEESIEESLLPVMFEPGDLRLTNKVKIAVEDFLLKQWQKGALMGAKQSEAYFVRVDLAEDATNTETTHKLIITVGLAVLKPAEFLIVGTSLPCQ